MDNDNVATVLLKGMPQPNTHTSTVSWPDPNPEFRKSTNDIENKVWFALDVTAADTIVIIHEGKRIVLDRKDFLQKVGLEW